MNPLIPVLVGIAGNLVTNEIARKRAPKQKAMIGSGTAPSLDSGIPIEIQEILGTQAKTPEMASKGEEGRSLSDVDEEMLLQMLLQQQEGIMGMYHGGNIHRYANGGGISSIFDTLNTMPQGLRGILAEIYENEDLADLQNALTGGFKGILGALLQKQEKRPGSQVSTRTLPAGNANRRRFQFEPIGMDDGGVLNRQMFKPLIGGGELDGPGGPKDDMIPIMASDGEFMLSKATVDMLGGGDHSKGIAALEKINNKGNRMYG
jgi:hypothetical protein